MKSMILPLLSDDVEGAKGSDRKVTVTGAAVYQSSVIKALVDWGRYDRYYLVRHSDKSHFQENPDSTLDRVRFASINTLPRFNHSDKVVFFAGQPSLHLLSPWRRGLKADHGPVSGIIHAMHTELFFMVLMRLLVAGDMQNYDALICTTRAGKKVVENGLEALAEQLERMWGVRLKFAPRLPVIPLGVSFSRFRSLDKQAARAALEIRPDETVFLYFGRFSTVDKADLAPMVISFCVTVAPTCPGARLVLAGDDSLHALAPGLQALADEIPYGRQVRLEPNVSSSRKVELFAAADVFVSPSDSIQETFGITLIEAMAAGLPVIASDWNGYKDIVLPGRTGFLVPTYVNPVGPGPDAALNAMFSWPGQIASRTVVNMDVWARHAIELAQSLSLRQKLGDAARSEVAAKYDWPAVIRKYEELWDELLEEAARSCQTPAPFNHRPFDVASMESLFAHYRSGNLGRQIVRLRPAIADLFSEPRMKERLMGPAGVFSEAIFNAVLTSAERVGSANVDAMAAIIALEQALPEAQVRSHMARLAKYGAMEFQPFDEAFATAAGSHFQDKKTSVL